jgi:hypothetical protein
VGWHCGKAQGGRPPAPKRQQGRFRVRRLKLDDWFDVIGLFGKEPSWKGLEPARDTAVPQARAVVTFAEAPRIITALRAGSGRRACRLHRTMHSMAASRRIIVRRTAIAVTVVIRLIGDAWVLGARGSAALRCIRCTLPGPVAVISIDDAAAHVDLANACGTGCGYRRAAGSVKA